MSAPSPPAPARTASIEVRDLVVRYGQVVAVRGVTFQVAAVDRKSVV